MVDVNDINYPIVDVHAHLDHPLIKDIEGVIKRAKAFGVKKIITNGLNYQTNRLSLDLAKKYDIVEAALGIYPPDALEKEVEEDGSDIELQPFNIDDELKFIKKQKPIALGEIGLEYKYGTDFEAQKLLFRKFIDLGAKLKVPLIIHSRKAEQNVIDILESANAKKVVLHCFCGKHKLVKRAAENGWHFSIPTNVLRSQHFQKVVEIVGINQLLTETDAPYLSPVPGTINEPSFIVGSIKKIAEIKKMTEQETANNIFKNYLQLF
ncbi:TatD family hydrolase [Candidatus Woesearchaeota archaeon]|jgi:TatD DNase family protein|nr:TatD family hydrolase [Candidatus Woesearchaeota archaeon]